MRYYKQQWHVQLVKVYAQHINKLVEDKKMQMYIVKPKVWRWRFSKIFVYKFDSDEALQDICRMHAGHITKIIAEYIAKTNFDLSTSQLAGKKYAEKL